jgi:cytochrome P450
LGHGSTSATKEGPRCNGVSRLQTLGRSWQAFTRHNRSGGALAITVIAELLGVPSEDRNKFREWSDAAVSGNATTEYLEKVLVPHMEAFSDYLRRMFEEKHM